jgi:hypothetical protein
LAARQLCRVDIFLLCEANPAQERASLGLRLTIRSVGCATKEAIQPLQDHFRM